MSLWHKINYIFTRRQRIQIIILFFLIIIGAVFELLGVSGIIPLVNVAIQPESMYENEYYVILADILNINTVNQFIIVWALVLCVLYVVKNLYLLCYKYFQVRFNLKINKMLSVKLMSGYLWMDYLFHVEHSAAELQRNVTYDVNSLTNTLFAILNLLVEIFTCVLLVASLFIMDFTTTIMIISILGIALCTYWYISKKLQYKYGQMNRAANREVNKWFLQAFGGIKEMKVMNREKFFVKHYEKAHNKSVEANAKNNIVTMMPKYVMETILICSLLLTMCFRLKQGTEITDFVTSLSAFAVAAMKMLPSFNKITENISVLSYNKAGLNNVFKDLKVIEEVDQHRQQKRVEKLGLENEIRIEDLSFRYPQGETDIFNHANMVIKRNSSVALVGNSGAGKTTLADIIIGVLPPTEGNILVDGKDIFANLDEWHNSIGYIPQMIYLMDDTIRANIVFGAPKESVNDEKVWKALERANLADFVRNLEKGLDTNVGDRGIKLSGGQRQRIGIARALYEEPDILILDEATSALDNETEAAVMESIESLHGSTTLIIIAHRLSTIENCDVVYEVRDGKIVCKQN